MSPPPKVLPHVDVINVTSPTHNISELTPNVYEVQAKPGDTVLIKLGLAWSTSFKLSDVTVGAVQKSCRIGLASGGENPAGAVFENLDKCSLIPESPSHSLSFDGLTIAASDSTVAISVAPDAGSGD